MGKCVSKQPVAGLNEFGSSPYLAICNEDDIIYINVGQSESKKSSKKAAAAAGLETKGTAMSFGFMHKHKIHHASSKGTSTTQGGDGTGPGSGTGTTKKATAGTNGNLLYGGGGDLEKEKATERDNATVISNPGVDGIFSDKNGNMGLASDDKSSATGRSTPRLQPPKKDSHGAPYRNNRFGFRSTNVVRPASVGLQPKTIADCDKQHSNNNNNYNNNNNIHTTNNNNVYITDKRRSKSASAAASARTTFTPVHQQAPSSQDRHYGALPKPQPKYHQSSAANGSAPKITPSEPTSSSSTTTTSITAKGTQQVMAKCDQAEHKNTQHNPPSPSSASASAQFGNGSVDEHRPQSSVNNANGQRQSVSFGGHQQKHVAANSLTKSTQEASTVAAKFTLHSSSLPKPQYPVPISLPSTTVPAPSHYAMDSKGAKQAVNISRKGTLQQRDRSGDRQLDDDDTVDSSPNIRMPRQRLRNLEMVLSGRHKFEVRDLETLTAEPIEALSLPKLPSAFGSNGQQLQPVPLSGLVRSSELPRQLSDDIDINDNRYESEQMLDGEYGLERKDSITSSDVESLEEEKLMRDNNSSEKSLKGALIKDLGESHCSKTSSPGSSRASWCNAGETMAPKECSSLSLSSSDEDNLIRRAAAAAANNRKALREEEDISSITVTAGNPSLLSSLSAVVPMDMSTNLDSISEAQNSFTEQDLNTMSDEPDNMFRTEETKFAEMAAAVGDAILLDDETSPTDSLVSSCTESDDARKNRKKAAEAKLEKEKEKDIDEISPELEELTSPVTPGTPTHASNSLSLSDNGRDFLIDDEIADQPALLFDEPAHNDSSMIDLASIHLNLNEDTPTLKDSISAANNNINRAASRSGAPVPKPRKIMSDVYESPAPIRKNRTRLSRAESLDTLSPCDSITSDDYMLDFNSSMDSINGPPRSNASGSASGLHSMDELQLWSELENKGQLMHEWSKLLRSQRNSNNNTSRESITSQLPARATRLLTRRLQNNATPTNCGSDSPRSMDSLPRRTAALSAAYKTVTLNQFNNNNNNNINGSGFNSMTDSASTVSNSAEDLTLLDKSLRNSMLQDVVHFKKQLVRLRRILQEDEENLMMTDTLNPFENNNGQFFTTATATTNGTGNLVEGAATGGPSSVDSKQQENTLIKESGVVALALLEDQRQELADLRRQVVYLQGEMTAKDRTIRQQQNLIEKYEAEREKAASTGVTTNGGDAADKQSTIDTISTATQTERLRPLSFGGPEGLASRSEPPSPSHGPAVRNGLRSPATNHHHHHHPHHNGNSSPATNSLALATTTTPASPQRSAAFNLKPKTQISSVYTQLSSIKHSTHNGSSTATNGSTTTTMATMAHHKRSSLGASNGNLCSASSVVSTSCNGGSSSPNKTVRTTHIGNVLTSSKLNQNGSNGTTPSSPPPLNGTKLLKTSIRTQSSPRHHPATPKRTSAIKPPSSFGGTFPEASSKSKSAPATPMVERVPVQIVIDAAVDDDKEDTNNNNENGHNGGDDDAGEEGEHVAETELDAIHNKINSLKLANGLTGCNDSSCKESSLVN